MGAAVTIRPLTSQEWQNLSALRLEALRECPGVFSSTYEKEKQNTPADWQDWLTQNGKCMFGLFDGVIMIGITGVFTFKGDATGQTGIMATSYIKPEYRGRGLSRMLYEARIDWAKGHLSWNKLIVSHRESNEASRRANQKWGFVYTHKQNKIWPDGQTEHEKCYELDLEQLRLKK